MKPKQINVMIKDIENIRFKAWKLLCNDLLARNVLLRVLLLNQIGHY